MIVICMKEEFNKCILCPRKCSVNRNCSEIGYCKAQNKIVIAKYYLQKAYHSNEQKHLLIPMLEKWLEL